MNNEQYTPPVDHGQRLANVREMAKVLAAGTTEKDGVFDVSDEAYTKALQIGQKQLPEHMRPRGLVRTTVCGIKVPQKTEYNVLLLGAMRLYDNTGFGYVRDIESTVFSRPYKSTPGELSRDVRTARRFKALPIAEKNKVRKVRRHLKKAAKRAADLMVKAGTPLHPR